MTERPRKPAPGDGGSTPPEKQNAGRTGTDAQPAGRRTPEAGANGASPPPRRDVKLTAAAPPKPERPPPQQAQTPTAARERVAPAKQGGAAGVDRVQPGRRAPEPQATGGPPGPGSGKEKPPPAAMKGEPPPARKGPEGRGGGARGPEPHQAKKSTPEPQLNGGAGAPRKDGIATASHDAPAKAAPTMSSRTDRGATGAGGDRATKDVPRHPVGEKIAQGHAYDKHVVKQGQFPDVHSRQEFANKVDDAVANGQARPLDRGRTAYWKDGIVVISDPSSPDGGSAYKPKRGYDYYLGLT